MPLGFIIVTALVFLLTLLVIVLVHEYGHFIMARRFDIKVLEFGFGLPPKVWGKKFGETLISLNILPIGGFVKLLGEDESDEKILNDPRSFAAKKVWQRMVVVASGVVMNLILAWILFYIVIISQGFRVIYPIAQPLIVVAEVVPGLPANQVGVKIGDRILSLDGQFVQSIEKAVTYIRSKPNQTILLTISDLNGKNQKTVKVIPTRKENGEGLLGIVFSPIPFKQYIHFHEKFFAGISYSYDLAELTFTALAKMFSDLASQNYQSVSESVAGPIGIAAATKNIVSLGIEGVLPYLYFMGVISLTLAIFNILPIPALDGGRLLFLLYELLLRRKASPAIERLIHSIGFVLLIALFVLVTFSDIRKLI